MNNGLRSIGGRGRPAKLGVSRLHRQHAPKHGAKDPSGSVDNADDYILDFDAEDSEQDFGRLEQSVPSEKATAQAVGGSSASVERHLKMRKTLTFTQPSGPGNSLPSSQARGTGSTKALLRHHGQQAGDARVQEMQELARRIQELQQARSNTPTPVLGSGQPPSRLGVAPTNSGGSQGMRTSASATSLIPGTVHSAAAAVATRPARSRTPPAVTGLSAEPSAGQGSGMRPALPAVQSAPASPLKPRPVVPSGKTQAGPKPTSAGSAGAQPEHGPSPVTSQVAASSSAGHPPSGGVPSSLQQASAAAAASSLQGRPVVAAGKPPTQVQKARAVNEQRKSMAAAQAFIQQLAAQATQQGTAVQPSEQHHATGPAPAPAADPASTAVAAAQPAGAASDAPLPSVAGAAASRLADGPPAAAKQAGAGAVLGKQAAQGRAGTSPQAQTPAAKRARLNKPVQARQAGQTGGTAAAGTVLGAAALADAVSLRAASSSPPDAEEAGQVSEDAVPLQLANGGAQAPVSSLPQRQNAAQGGWQAPTGQHKRVPSLGYQRHVLHDGSGPASAAFSSHMPMPPIMPPGAAGMSGMAGIPGIMQALSLHPMLETLPLAAAFMQGHGGLPFGMGPGDPLGLLGMSLPFDLTRMGHGSTGSSLAMGSHGMPPIMQGYSQGDGALPMGRAAIPGPRPPPGPAPQQPSAAGRATAGTGGHSAVDGSSDAIQLRIATGADMAAAQLEDADVGLAANTPLPQQDADMGVHHDQDVQGEASAGGSDMELDVEHHVHACVDAAEAPAPEPAHSETAGAAGTAGAPACSSALDAQRSVSPQPGHEASATGVMGSPVDAQLAAPGGLNPVTAGQHAAPSLVPDFVGAGALASRVSMSDAEVNAIAQRVFVLVRWKMLQDAASGVMRQWHEACMHHNLVVGLPPEALVPPLPGPLFSPAPPSALHQLPATHLPHQGVPPPPLVTQAVQGHVRMPPAVGPVGQMAWAQRALQQPAQAGLQARGGQASAQPEEQGQLQVAVSAVMGAVPQELGVETDAAMTDTAAVANPVEAGEQGAEAAAGEQGDVAAEVQVAQDRLVPSVQAGELQASASTLVASAPSTTGAALKPRKWDVLPQALAPAQASASAAVAVAAPAAGPSTLLPALQELAVAGPAQGGADTAAAPVRHEGQQAAADLAPAPLPAVAPVPVIPIPSGNQLLTAEPAPMPHVLLGGALAQQVRAPSPSATAAPPPPAASDRPAKRRSMEASDNVAVQRSSGGAGADTGSAAPQQLQPVPAAVAASASPSQGSLATKRLRSVTAEPLPRRGTASSGTAGEISRARGVAAASTSTDKARLPDARLGEPGSGGKDAGRHTLAALDCDRAAARVLDTRRSGDSSRGRGREQDRDRERVRDRDRVSERERERELERDKERERDRDRERNRDREREKERDRDRDRERGGQRDRELERGRESDRGKQGQQRSSTDHDKVTYKELNRQQGSPAGCNHGQSSRGTGREQYAAGLPLPPPPIRPEALPADTAGREPSPSSAGAASVECSRSGSGSSRPSRFGEPPAAARNLAETLSVLPPPPPASPPAPSCAPQKVARADTSAEAGRLAAPAPHAPAETRALQLATSSEQKAQAQGPDESHAATTALGAATIATGAAIDQPGEIIVLPPPPQQQPQPAETQAQEAAAPAAPAVSGLAFRIKPLLGARVARAPVRAASTAVRGASNSPGPSQHLHEPAQQDAAAGAGGLALGHPSAGTGGNPTAFKGTAGQQPSAGGPHFMQHDRDAEGGQTPSVPATGLPQTSSTPAPFLPSWRQPVGHAPAAATALPRSPPPAVSPPVLLPPALSHMAQQPPLMAGPQAMPHAVSVSGTTPMVLLQHGQGGQVQAYMSGMLPAPAPNQHLPLGALSALISGQRQHAGHVPVPSAMLAQPLLPGSYPSHAQQLGASMHNQPAGVVYQAMPPMAAVHHQQYAQAAQPWQAQQQQQPSSQAGWPMGQSQQGAMQQIVDQGQGHRYAVGGYSSESRQGSQSDGLGWHTAAPGYRSAEPLESGELPNLAGMRPQHTSSRGQAMHTVDDQASAWGRQTALEQQAVRSLQALLQPQRPLPQPSLLPLAPLTTAPVQYLLSASLVYVPMDEAPAALPPSPDAWRALSPEPALSDAEMEDVPQAAEAAAAGAEAASSPEQTPRRRPSCGYVSLKSARSLAVGHAPDPQPAAMNAELQQPVTAQGQDGASQAAMVVPAGGVAAQSTGKQANSAGGPPLAEQVPVAPGTHAEGLAPSCALPAGASDSGITKLSEAPAPVVPKPLQPLVMPAQAEADHSHAAELHVQPVAAAAAARLPIQPSQSFAPSITSHAAASVAMDMASLPAGVQVEPEHGTQARYTRASFQLSSGVDSKKGPGEFWLTGGMLLAPGPAAQGTSGAAGGGSSGAHVPPYVSPFHMP